jgi:hypothetical protein
LYTIDITNPSNPIEISYFDIDETAQSVSVDGNYAYVSAEENLHVIDISTPAAPFEDGFFGMHGSMEAPLNCAVAGSLVYVAYGSEGLVILRFTPPNQIYLPFI